eukprot:jgi/Bigna1/85762/estExt_fgenesh1_pg.C_60037
MRATAKIPIRQRKDVFGLEVINFRSFDSKTISPQEKIQEKSLRSFPNFEYVAFSSCDMTLSLFLDKIPDLRHPGLLAAHNPKEKKNMESKEPEVKYTKTTGYRTHSCGELRIGDVGKEVTLSGWVQKSRDQRGMAFVDIRDRYGQTQCVFPNPGDNPPEEKKGEKERYEIARKLGREYVIQVTGKVIERSNKSKDKATGAIELAPTSIKVLNQSKTPPFKIESETDGLEEIRMKYRFLDIRRDPVKDALILRAKCAQVVRNYLAGEGFIEPDLRYGMKLKNLTELAKGKGLKMFDESELVVGIVCEGLAKYSKKKIKELEKLAKDQSIGASGMVWVKCEEVGEDGKSGKFKSSVDKFFKAPDLAAWAKLCGAKTGDMILVFWGDDNKARDAMGKFRHEMGTRLGLRNKGFYGLWVVDFPLFEWDEDEKRWCAMHHPFTSPKPEDVKYLKDEPGKVRANAYDMVINGVEVGGGSIRIHDRDIQMTMFEKLGFTKEEAEKQFGFLMGAFEYGAPPHGGLAFGFDRLCSILGNETSIRNFIAFPKNKMGRDLMINAPSEITGKQLEELSIAVAIKEKKTAE